MEKMHRPIRIHPDDIFGGADTIEETITIAREINWLCMAGGFPLQKWVSSHQSILHTLPPSNRAQTTNIAIEDHTVVYSLGLSWNLSTDNFELAFNFKFPSIAQLVAKCTIFVEHLQDLPSLTCPRGIGNKNGFISEVYGFSDASPPAVAADVCSRWQSSAGEISVRMVQKPKLLHSENKPYLA